MIDLHTHILPGIDDGAPDLDASLEIARASASDGVSLMIATPHVNGRYMPDPGTIRTLARDVNRALAEEELALVVSTGAEIALSELSGLDDEALNAYGLGGSRTLLIESPYVDAVPFLDQMIFDLQTRGHRVLLAHPERCPMFQRDPEMLERLVGREVLCSVTAGSLAGRFGRRVRTFAIELIQEGFVHNISSDTHNVAGRPPGLATGFERAERQLPGISGLKQWLTEGVPSALLSDEPLPPYPALGLRMPRRLGFRR